MGSNEPQPGSLTPHPYQLRAVAIESLSCERLLQFSPDPGPQPDVALDLSLNTTVEVTTPHECVARVTVDIPTAATLKAIKSPFQLRCVMSGAIQSRDEVTPQDLLNFGQTFALWLLWPYIRQSIQNMTTQMGLQPFTLPTLQIMAGTPTRQPSAQNT